MSAPENPPAFPVRIESPMGVIDIKEGMTLRDWFAGQIIPAIVAATSAGQHSPIRGGGEQGNEAIEKAMARDAYSLADAMLAERENRS